MSMLYGGGDEEWFVALSDVANFRAFEIQNAFFKVRPRPPSPRLIFLFLKSLKKLTLLTETNFKLINFIKLRGSSQLKLWKVFFFFSPKIIITLLLLLKSCFNSNKIFFLPIFFYSTIHSNVIYLLCKFFRCLQVLSDLVKILSTHRQH